MPRGNRVSRRVASSSFGRILAIDRAARVLRFAYFFFSFSFFFFWPFLLFGEIGLDPDASDEPQWYIPAGIELPDLQRSLTVIEQFETTPLDLEGKRAAQLLRKKRQTRRRRRRRRTATASDSEGETRDDGDGDDDDDDERKRKVARKAREQEKYMSAQFIEDSDEEYGRDIEGFFAREAALRERTALAAIDSLSHIGTMRPTGTKKRRRAQQQPTLPTATDASTTASATPQGGREAKRTRRSAALSTTSTSTSGMHDGDGEDGDRGRFSAGALRRSSRAAAASISDDDADVADGDDDDGGGDDGSGGRDIDHGDSSSLVYRDVAAGKHRHPDPPPLVASKTPRRPRARPRYRGVAPDNTGPDAAPPPPEKGTDDADDEGEGDVGQAQQGHDQPLPTGATSPMPPLPESHKGDPGRASSSTSSSNGGGPRKGRTRLIISDEEE
jgi:hypothetical protein